MIDQSNTMQEGWNINRLSYTNVRPSEYFERVTVDQRSRIDRRTVGTKYPHRWKTAWEWRFNGSCVLKASAVGSIEDQSDGFSTHNPIDSTVDTASFNVIEICSLSSFLIVTPVGCRRNYYWRQPKIVLKFGLRVLLKGAVNYKLRNTLVFICFFQFT